jgi:MoxR-like ATPase
MNPRQLQNFLATLVSKRLHQSVMIWGPPGIGKSHSVAEVAREAKIDLVDLRLSQLAPTDLRGLPVADHKDRTSRWYPPEFLPRSGHGILFLDELNMAPPAMQGIAQQLVLDRQVGSYSLPEGWHVWAAGNRIEDGASVFQMPSALQNRFIHLSVEPHFDSFRQWALGHGVHEHIVAFLAFRPALLHQRDPAQPAWPSPRAWTAANALHQAGLPIEPAVGKGAAGEFQAYGKVYASLPDLDAILAGTAKSPAFPKSPDARYATAIGLATRARDQKSVKNALAWIVDRADPEWIQLFIHAKLDTAAADNTTGIIATVLAANPKVKKFLESYRRLLLEK